MPLSPQSKLDIVDLATRFCICNEMLLYTIREKAEEKNVITDFFGNGEELSSQMMQEENCMTGYNTQ